MQKYIMLLLCLLLLSCSRVTQVITDSTVDIQTAVDIAKKVVDLDGASVTKYTSKGLPVIYAVKDKDSFALVSADYTSTPILAYSDDNTFPDVIESPEVKWWLALYTKQINAGRDNGIVRTAEEWNKDLPIAVRPPIQSVNPLMTTLWHQGSPYNQMCPEINGVHAVAGCVAIAMAQVCKYWQKPIVGQGSFTYVNQYYGTISATFNVPYNWSNMGNTNSAGNMDVAVLVYHCGVAAWSLYTPSGTGAYPLYARQGMIDYLKYRSTMSEKRAYNYSISQWQNILKTELNASRPIIYVGAGNGVAHAFVCDGYQNTNYFHFNWGWGGSADGYYYLNDLSPNSYNFTYEQSALVGIKPGR